MNDTDKARVRDAVAVYTAVHEAGGDLSGTALADYSAHMTEAGRLVADLPPGDREVKERFILLLGEMNAALVRAVAPVSGMVIVANVLLQVLSTETGKSEVDLLRELALRLA